MESPVFVLANDGCTTACIVITPFGSSPRCILHCPTVLLFSKIFPALINLTSFAALGAIFLSVSRWNISLRTGSYILADKECEGRETRRVKKYTNIEKVKNGVNILSSNGKLQVQTITIIPSQLIEHIFFSPFFFTSLERKPKL